MSGNMVLKVIWLTPGCQDKSAHDEKLAVVFGGGFGLYGHSIALQELGFNIVLPLKYKTTINNRKDLKSLSSAIFCSNDDIWKLSKVASLYCLARRPQDNFCDVVKLCGSGFDGTIISEKPLATSPRCANQLMKNWITPWLVADSKGVRQFGIPYIFIDTVWFNYLQEAVQEDSSLEVIWQHCVTNQLYGWKKEIALGGGSLNFYAIHILAMLVHLSKVATEKYKIEMNKIEGKWVFKYGRIRVTFLVGSIPNFSISTGAQTLYSAISPFGDLPKRGQRDPRIDLLKRFYRRTISEEFPVKKNSYHLEITRAWANASVADI